MAWKKPPEGWFKLNCDDSCRCNPGNSGGGGVIRDETGRVKGAFSACFGIGTNNEAEVRAVREGIALCKKLNFVNMIIESDSKLVVNWLRRGKYTVWYLWDFWEELLKDLVGLNVLVLHQFREGN